MRLSLSRLVVTQSSVLSQGLPDPVQAAASEFRSRLFIEGMGIFWIAAEIVILLIVIQARRTLDSGKVPLPRFTLEGLGRSTALGMCIVISIAAFTFGRHFIIEPMPRILEKTVVDRATVSSIEYAYTLRATVHTVIWSIFITAWVALEAAIVFQGYKAYKRFERLFARV